MKPGKITIGLVFALFLLTLSASAPAQSRSNPATSQRAGIGLGIQIEGNKSVDEYSRVSDAHPLMVVHLVKNCPAEKAGIKVGDRITKVDGNSVDGMTIPHVINHVKGRKGTPVQITFVHHDAKESLADTTVAVIRTKEFCRN